MNRARALAAVPDDADTFLRILGDRHTFQTFGEGTAKGKAELSRILHGTLAEHRATLGNLNARGAGIFVMVNAGDGDGRKAANVQSVRALFVDLDGAPLEPVKAAPLPAHCIVESSPNHWHAYWRIADCPLSDFTPLQRALAERFAADAKVCDLPRVMRIPGFLHRKGKPFASQIVALCDALPYTLAAFRAAFGFTVPLPLPTTPKPPHRQRAHVPAQIPEGERNAALFNLARGLVQKGFAPAQVNGRLQRINAERCQPPLCAAEVDTIAANASAYGSDGFAMLPHKLLDSREWKALTPRAHDVILTAFRRHNGTGAAIALTWADFQGLPGFGKKRTFYKARNEAVQSEIIERGCEGRNTQTGRKPDLFQIAPQWLRLSPVPKREPCASTQKVHPYIDKQLIEENRARKAKGANETRKRRKRNEQDRAMKTETTR
jgi:hypothetical protein